MAAPAVDLRQIVREEVQRSWGGIALFILGSLSTFYIFILFVVVPKFQQIYIDALPGMPLPVLTKCVVNGRLALIYAALAWPIVGVILWRRRNRHTNIWINVGIILFLSALGTTIFALWMPMVVMDVGMSDAGK